MPINALDAQGNSLGALFAGTCAIEQNHQDNHPPQPPDDPLCLLCGTAHSPGRGSNYSAAPRVYRGTRDFPLGSPPQTAKFFPWTRPTTRTSGLREKSGCNWSSVSALPPGVCEDMIYYGLAGCRCVPALSLVLAAASLAKPLLERRHPAIFHSSMLPQTDALHSKWITEHARSVQVDTSST